MENLTKLFEKIVEKVWGFETVICNNTHYCSKILYLHPHYQSSLHFHSVKNEVFHCIKGIVLVETAKLNIGKHYDIEGELQRHILMPHKQIEIPAELAHRFTAIITDSALMETSSFHADCDSYRLEKSRELSTQEIKDLNDYFLSTIKEKNMKKAVFFDRDGTLTHNNRSKKGGSYYVLSPDQLEWIDGSMELLQMFKDQAYHVFVITMQNCIKEGKITLEMADQIMQKMCKDADGLIDDYKICQSIEETDESKALSKMRAIMQLAAQYDIDLSESIAIGDTNGDCLSARKANVKTVYQIILPFGDKESELADKHYKSLLDLHADLVFNRITGGYIKPEGVSITHD